MNFLKNLLTISLQVAIFGCAIASSFFQAIQSAIASLLNEIILNWNS